MAFDPNNRASVDQFTLRARNEGHSDEEIIEYIRKQRASQAGKTLQSRQQVPESTWKTALGSILGSNPSYVGNVMTPAGRNLYEGVMLPQVAGSVVGGPVGAGVGAGIGSVVADVRGKQLSPPEEQPSLGGSAFRAALNTAVPMVGGMIANKMAVATGPGGAGVAEPALREVPEKVGKGPAIAVGQALKEAVRAVRGKMQPEWYQKQALLKQMESDPTLNQAANRIDIRGLIEKMRSYFPAGKATGDTGEDAARAYLTKKADELAAEAGPQLEMPLSRVNEFIGSLGRMGWRESGASVTRTAAKFLRNDFKAAEEAFITRVHGPEAAAKIKSLNEAISTRLAAADDVRSFFTKAPSGMVNAIRDNPDMADAVEAFDAKMGTSFAKDSMAYHDAVARVSKLREEIKAGNRSAMQAYKEAVRAADAAKQKAMFGAKILSHAAGAVGGYFMGETLGLPGSRWMGLIAGGMMGDRIAPLVAKGLGAAGRVAPKVAPVAAQTEREIEKELSK